MPNIVKNLQVKKAIQLYVHNPNITAQEVANKLGVNKRLVYSWRQDPNFIDAVYDSYMLEFGLEVPAVLKAMIREAKAGNVQAGRLILEHSGKLVKNVNITVDSPYEKFLKSEKVEIEYEDAEVEEIIGSIPEIKEDLPERNTEDQNKRAEREKNDIKKQISNQKRNKKRRELYNWQKKAEKLGIPPLPAKRPTPAQKEAWINEIKAKEEQQR